jgi:hypothetical protein
MLWLALATVASSALPVPSIVADFMRFCGPQGQSTPAVLAQADRAGWETSALGALRDFDPATQRLKKIDQGWLKLAVATLRSAGEQRQACGLTSTSAVPGIVAAAQAALGIKPSLDTRMSATFYAVRKGNIWQAGAGLSLSKIAIAKAAGRFYSIVASTTGSGATIYALHVMPATTP